MQGQESDTSQPSQVALTTAKVSPNEEKSDNGNITRCPYIRLPYENMEKLWSLDDRYKVGDEALTLNLPVPTGARFHEGAAIVHILLVPYSCETLRKHGARDPQPALIRLVNLETGEPFPAALAILPEGKRNAEVAYSILLDKAQTEEGDEVTGFLGMAGTRQGWIATMKEVEHAASRVAEKQKSTGE